MILKLLICIILALNFFVLLWPVLPVRRKPRWLDFFPAIALILCVLEFFLDRFSVRMVPVYLLTALVFLITFGRLRRPSQEQPRRRAVAITAGLLGLIVLSISAALPLWILSFDPLPEPTGPYAVGTVTYSWVDSSRPETYTADPNDHRELPVQIWYPVDKTARTAGSENAGAPVSPAQVAYPLVIFSPGALGPRDSNDSTYQELASHGYIVAAIDHTYQSAYTSFPDGRVILFSPIFMQEMQAHAQATLGDPVEDDRIVRGWIAIHVADLNFVVDQLEGVNRGDPGGPLTGKVDLGRIGLIGHSLGGISIVDFCRQDARCQAAVNLDGPLFADRLSITSDGEQTLVETPFPRPLMQMYSGTLYNDPRYFGTVYVPNRAAYERATEPSYALVFEGAGHANFTDLPLISPMLANVLGIGPINPYHCIRIVNAYALAFFDKYLNGQGSPLLDAASPDYPEVKFASRN
jgi:dienelactone hydrolase